MRKRLHCVLGITLIVCISPVSLSGQAPASDALFRKADVPVERRIDDLLSRMTLEEKVRQLDMYSSATSIVDKHTDDTHAASDAVFLPERLRRFGEI